MDKKIILPKNRAIKSADFPKIIYIEHLGTEPYNEVKFECGKTLIVSYSLTHWHKIFGNFHRINRSVLINPEKVISQFGSIEVELTDNSTFQYSRRKFKTA